MKFLLVASASILFSLGAMAQSAPQAGHECDSDFDFGSAAFHCYNPDSSDDVRFSAYEFQTCNNGNITDMIRRISVLYLKVNTN